MNNQSIEQTFFRQFYQDVQSPDVDENLLQIIEKCKGLQPLQFATGSTANFCNFSTRNTKAIPDDIFDKFEEFLFQEQLRNLKKINPNSLKIQYRDELIKLQNELSITNYTLKDKEKMLSNPIYGNLLTKLIPSSELKGEGAGIVFYSKNINFTKQHIPCHRLYINVDGKASLDFVKIFIQNFDANNLPYIIKNTLTDIDGQTRSDLVVIYLDDMTLKYGINLCEHIKEKVPSIANSIDNPPVLTGKYHNWIGYGFENNESIRSFNQTMSDILFESIAKGLGKEVLKIYDKPILAKKTEKQYYTNLKTLFLSSLTNSAIKCNADTREYFQKYSVLEDNYYRIKELGYIVENPKDPILIQQVFSYFYNTFTDNDIKNFLANPLSENSFPSINLNVPHLGQVFINMKKEVPISALCKLVPILKKHNPNFLETIKQEIPKAIAEYKNRYPEFEKSGLHFDPGKICFAATDEQYHNRYGNDSHLPQGPLKHKKEHEKAKFMSSSDIAILKDNNNLYVAGEKQLLNESLYKKFLQSYKFNKILFYPVTKNKKNIIKIGDSTVSFVCKDGTNYKIDGNLAKFFEIKNPQNIKPKVATNEITTNAQKKDFKIIPKGGVAVFNYDNSLYVIGEEMMDTVQEYLTHNYIFKSGLFYKISPSKNNVIKIGDIQFSITNEREGYKITGNGIEGIDVVSKPNKNK